MIQKKLESVLKEKTFAEKIFKLQTPEEVQAAFKEKGIEISVEEVQLLGSIINKMVEKHTSNLSEDDLEEIAGGTDDESWSKNYKKGFNLLPLDLYGLARMAMSDETPVAGKLGIIASGATIAGILITTGVGLGACTVLWAYNKALADKKAKGIQGSHKIEK